MAEDFSTYTDYDPEDYIDIPSDYRADFTMEWGASAGRLSYDFGAGHFAGDIEHQLEPWSDVDHVDYGQGGWTTLFMLTNILGLANSVSDAIGVVAINLVNSHTERFYVFEVYGGVVYLSSSFWGTSTPGSWRYTRLARSGNTLTWTAYTDETYTVVSSTISLTLHGTSAYRYVQIGGGRSDGNWGTMVTSGIQNLVLSLTVVPTVSADPATDIAANSSTLNGTLDDDGGEACDCGFEWGLDIGYGTSTPPQSKTTGEAFSQVIGGLFPNTTYHFRAFATNSVGTGHGADRTFTTTLIINKAYALARREL